MKTKTEAFKTQNSKVKTNIQHSTNTNQIQGNKSTPEIESYVKNTNLVLLWFHQIQCESKHACIIINIQSKANLEQLNFHSQNIPIKNTIKTQKNISETKHYKNTKERKTL